MFDFDEPYLFFTGEISPVKDFYRARSDCWRLRHQRPAVRDLWRPDVIPVCSETEHSRGLRRHVEPRDKKKGVDRLKIYLSMKNFRVAA